MISLDTVVGIPKIHILLMMSFLATIPISLVIGKTYLLILKKYFDRE
jgi:hypothetical protein